MVRSRDVTTLVKKKKGKVNSRKKYFFHSSFTLRVFTRFCKICASGIGGIAGSN